MTRPPLGRPSRRTRVLALLALLVPAAAAPSACSPAPTPPLLPGSAIATVPPISNVEELADWLTEHGVPLVDEGDKSYEWFTAPGRTFAIEAAAAAPVSGTPEAPAYLVVHDYGEEAAAVTAAAGVDGSGSLVARPDGERIKVHWPAAARLYRRGRLLAVYVGEDPRIMHLLTLALGEQFAGPIPPPGVGVR